MDLQIADIAQHLANVSARQAIFPAIPLESLVEVHENMWDELAEAGPDCGPMVKANTDTIVTKGASIATIEP
jgi:hypothetical protein